ncbi:MAG: ADP-ribosylglycohydrolase family protein [Muribaculaceae bacterium]|nr:ADP-ribosylglycohydrolase family protein [Muribaculaceae bacterium]
MTQERLQDKTRGSLIGGAIGDAFGYPIEFIFTYKEIVAKYGEGGLVEYDTSYPWLDDSLPNSEALFSDDTQMTLYTAEGLLEAEKSGAPLMPTIRNAYIAWFGPQVGMKMQTSYKSELIQIKDLNQRRAPGNTCLSSLSAIYSGGEPSNDSKGCGGVMRVAPIGLFGASHNWPLAKTAGIAGEAAEITHLHPLSTYSSAALAVICQICVTTEVVNPNQFKKCVGHALQVVSDVYGENASAMKDFKEIINRAISFEDNPLQDWEVIEKNLGGGWVAEETLAIAIFSVLRHIHDFKGCLICAVNHGGDSDSTGAVAGNIIGAILGNDAIPEYFKDNIQLQDLLLSTADRLLGNSR